MGKTPKAKMMNILAGHHVPAPRWEPTTAWAPQKEEDMRAVTVFNLDSELTGEQSYQVVVDRKIIGIGREATYKLAKEAFNSVRVPIEEYDLSNNLFWMDNEVFWMNWDHIVVAEVGE